MEQIKALTAEVEGEYVKVVLTDGRLVSIPKSEFKPSGKGLAPDFSDVGIIDGGSAIKFGEYEACMDAIQEDIELGRAQVL